MVCGCWTGRARGTGGDTRASAGLKDARESESESVGDGGPVDPELIVKVEDSEDDTIDGRGPRWIAPSPSSSESITANPY